MPFIVCALCFGVLFVVVVVQIIVVEHFDPAHRMAEAAGRGDRAAVVGWLDEVDINATHRCSDDISCGPALRRAVESGNRELVEMLLARGADPNKTGGYGGSAMRSAVKRPTMMALLMRHGGDPHARNITPLPPLHLAVHYGETETVITMLDAGADVDQAVGRYGLDTFGGFTPLGIALAEGHVLLARKLHVRGGTMPPAVRDRVLTRLADEIAELRGQTNHFYADGNGLVETADERVERFAAARRMASELGDPRR